MSLPMQMTKEQSNIARKHFEHDFGDWFELNANKWADVGIERAVYAMEVAAMMRRKASELEQPFIDLVSGATPTPEPIERETSVLVAEGTPAGKNGEKR